MLVPISAELNFLLQYRVVPSTLSFRFRCRVFCFFIALESSWIFDTGVGWPKNGIYLRRAQVFTWKGCIFGDWFRFYFRGNSWFLCTFAKQAGGLCFWWCKISTATIAQFLHSRAFRCHILQKKFNYIWKLLTIDFAALFVWLSFGWCFIS